MNRYLQIMQPAIDSFGLIAQLPTDSRDGGDTAQREGMFMLLSYVAQSKGLITQDELNEIKARYLGNYSRLRETCMPGEIRRHVDTTKWYGLNWRMSRDQWTPNVISLGLVGTLKMKADMVLGCAMRLFFVTTNLIPNYVVKGQPGYEIKFPDLAVMSCWGYMMRWCPLFWPLLLITDLDLLVNSLLWKYYYLANPNNTNTDILNHTNSLLQAYMRMPTPVSLLARKLLTADQVCTLLDRYFAEDGPAINVIAREVLPKVW